MYTQGSWALHQRFGDVTLGFGELTEHDRNTIDDLFCLYCRSEFKLFRSVSETL